jgi:voltage-gated potassium channel
LETNPPLFEPYRLQWQIFELVSIIIFTIEYGFRVWSCPVHRNIEYQDPIKGRLKFMMSPMALVDLLAFFPYYIPLFLTLNVQVFRVLRLIRIIRILHIGYFTNAIDAIAYALKEKKQELIISLFIGLVFLIFSSTIMYYAEYEVQPEVFSDIPSTMWWGVITLTSVGYGDMVPLTSLGRFTAVATSFVGLGLISLPTGILGSGLMEALNYEKIGIICPVCFYSFRTHMKYIC